VNPLRSVGARLSLALLLVVVGALTIVYMAVAPSLESRLINSRLDDLERSAPTLAAQLAKHPFDPDFFEQAAATSNARVVFFHPLSQTPQQLSVAADSRGGASSADILDDPIARKASLFLEPRSGTTSRNGERFVEAAAPVGDDGSVLLLSASLDRALGDVELVKRRLLVAGALVLVLVFVVGYAGAWMFARRIRRLERAAERIANGMFDEPVTDLGNDEVGELARAFERMRVRLAQLEHARREFIANASHELRTPVFSLGGFLELLDDEDLDEETHREFLQTMREQVARLEKLATELLDLSRLDAGHLDLQREVVSLDEVAQTVVAEFAAVALQTAHVLEVSAENGTFAAGDEQRLLQIARALVENALIHTPPETRVSVVTSQEGPVARLSVHDTGPGIDVGQAAQVFDRFYRADGTRTSGSGLGLAIARELARVMGGTLEVSSSPGATTFVLTLQAADSVTPERKTTLTAQPS
jgi:signal transduction histidine kinase